MPFYGKTDLEIQRVVDPAVFDAIHRLLLELIDEALVDGVRIDYVLPRSETLNYRVPWNITVDVKSTQPIASLYSPSHELDLTRISDHEIRASIRSAMRHAK